MHEEALLRDLRRKLVEVGRQEHAVRISRAAVWIGALCHLSEGTLRSRWPDVVEGTIADRAQLEVVVSMDPSNPRAPDLVLTHVDISADAENAMGRPSGARQPHEPGGSVS